MLYVGAIKFDAGSLDRGQVVALYNYMTQILVELIKLANLIITVTKSFACAGRITAVLDMQPSLKSGELTEPPAQFLLRKKFVRPWRFHRPISYYCVLYLRIKR